MPLAKNFGLFDQFAPDRFCFLHASESAWRLIARFSLKRAAVSRELP
jgi:hypothetical protein